MSGTTQSGTPQSAYPVAQTAADTDMALILQQDATGVARTRNQPAGLLVAGQVPAGAQLLAAGPGAVRGATGIEAPTGAPIAGIALHASLEVEDGVLQVVTGAVAGMPADGAALAGVSAGLTAVSKVAAAALPAASVGAAGGVAALDANGALVLGGAPLFQVKNGRLYLLPGFPTADPLDPDAVYLNGQYLMVSTGSAT